MRSATPQLTWIDLARRGRGAATTSASPLSDTQAITLGRLLSTWSVEPDLPLVRVHHARPTPNERAGRHRSRCAIAALGLLIATILTVSTHEPPSRGSLRARDMFAAFKSSRSTGVVAMRSSVVTGVLSAGLVAGGALAQDAVQWRVEDGGNGHWYRGITNQSGWTWTIAFQDAQTYGGQLVSCETAGELSFVIQTFSYSQAPLLWQVQSINPAAKMGPWIGALQVKEAIEPNGGWTWLTGLTFDPQDNVNCCGNDCSGVQEDRLHLYAQQSTGWTVALNDLTDDPSACSAPLRGAVIEWSADCNSDGIVDFGQIRAGELEDANTNNIPDCCEQGVACNCPADLDGNGNVDAVDLAVILSKWGTNGGKDYPQADVDGSGEIDGADLATVLSNWGPCL